MELFQPGLSLCVLAAHPIGRLGLVRVYAVAFEYIWCLYTECGNENLFGNIENISFHAVRENYYNVVCRGKLYMILKEIQKPQKCNDN